VNTDSTTPVMSSAVTGRKASFFKTMKWRILIIMVICITPLLFADVGPDYYSLRMYRALWDMGHIPFFMLSTYVVVRVLRSRVTWSGTSWVLIIMGGALFIGGLTEIIQGYVGRSVSMRDLYSDLVGAFLVVAWYSPIHRRTAHAAVVLLRVSAIILLLFALVPILTDALDETLARQQFPVLAGLENPSEVSRFKGNVSYNRVRFNAAEKNYSLRVRFQGKGHEWMNLWHFPRDWQGYDWFRFSVFNDGDAFDVNLRINDLPYIRSKMEYSDRYNQQITLESGWNHFAIALQDVERGPAARRMDLSKIWSIGFFVRDLDRRATIYLDDMRLERR
jgi:VanZ family protein